MKILLINPPWERLLGNSYSNIPLGLSYLASVLEKDHRVLIYNADFCLQSHYPIWKEVENTILSLSPDLVGISVMTPKYYSALNISRIVKNIDSEIPVVWGGPHPTVSPDESLKNEEVDFVVRGEGEYTFFELINALDNSRDISNILGISYKMETENRITHNRERPLIRNLDELPFPAKHLILSRKEQKPIDFGAILNSRGCPYNCIFCAAHKVWTKKVRFRSPEKVVEEVKYTQEKFGTRIFVFEDDNFMLNKRHAEKICDLLIKEKIDIEWSCDARADQVSADLIKKMKKAGCYAISVGVESGSEETLKRIKKGITIKQIRDAAKIIKDNGIKFSAFFMIGFPWETRNDIRKTISLMREIKPYQAWLSVATPHPGTEFYDLCMSEGLIKGYDPTRFHQSSNFLSKNLSREETEKLVGEAKTEVDKYNRTMWKRDLLSNPLKTIKHVMRGDYSIKELWDFFVQFIRL